MKVSENSKKIEIHVKNGFSDRKGITHFFDIVQINDLNKRTRNMIYNCIKDIFDKLSYDYSYRIDLGKLFVEYIYKELFSLADKDFPEYGGNYAYEFFLESIYSIIEEYDYVEVFTFIEGLINCFKKMDKITYGNYKFKIIFISKISKIFEDENVNYRIVGDIITDIVNEYEIKEIEETLANSYDIVKKHYNKAIEKLYKDKDFSNSIKESISSVEAMSQVITGKNNATLGDALKMLRNDIHPAMKSAFEKLYGYTSDANGIRHSNGIGEGNSTFEEAKYMLISCSAFVNYLKENFKNKEN